MSTFGTLQGPSSRCVQLLRVPSFRMSDSHFTEVLPAVDHSMTTFSKLQTYSVLLNVWNEDSWF